MPSNVIRAWAYEPDAGALVVTFLNGRRYRYAGVPADLADEMRLAFAKGAFFNRRIRGRYPAESLSEGTHKAALMSQPTQKGA